MDAFGAFSKQDYRSLGGEREPSLSTPIGGIGGGGGSSAAGFGGAAPTGIRASGVRSPGSSDPMSPLQPPVPNPASGFGAMALPPRMGAGLGRPMSSGGGGSAPGSGRPPHLGAYAGGAGGLAFAPMGPVAMDGGGLGGGMGGGGVGGGMGGGMGAYGAPVPDYPDYRGLAGEFALGGEYGAMRPADGGMLGMGGAGRWPGPLGANPLGGG
eukprot:CAMPEP_0185423038 /NCGR_PEP_ID=MMETSP1365-20130426/12212_1 /TAXON_ID=38817 /ORGANISM="Gephyrocapsa oceanica, Strain RCC1303" /LENGTH=210 /DNA_ID=CAMNT_0028026873 /DNA_START=58 /DNA_END=687 /DNA_ORIENTATION=-